MCRLRAPIHQHVAGATAREKNQVVGDPRVGAQPSKLLFVDILDDLEGLMRFLGEACNGIEIERVLSRFLVGHWAAPILGTVAIAVASIP